jgi:hypothetical protein
VYFGYETMWTFTFIPIAFVLVMVGGIALAFVYAVGAAKGKAAAVAYTRVWTAVIVVGLAVNVGVAVINGQFGRFVELAGWSPLFEMGLLGVMFVVAMLLMATSYLGSKKA